MPIGIRRKRTEGYRALTLATVWLSLFAGCGPHTGEAEDAAQKGFAALNQHNVSDARLEFQRAADHGSTDPDVWRGLTGLHMQAREFAQATVSGQRLTELAPNAADGWKILGTACYRVGSQDRAYNAFTRAAALTPEDLDVQQGIGQSGIQIGRLPEAKQAFEKVLQAKPDNPLALAGHALLLVRLVPTPQGLAQAEQEIGRSLAQKETGNAHLVRAQIYLAERRGKEAIVECKTVTTQYPHLSLAYSLLAKAYSATGQAEEARQAGSRYEALLAQGNVNTPNEESQP